MSEIGEENFEDTKENLTFQKDKVYTQRDIDQQISELKRKKKKMAKDEK